MASRRVLICDDDYEFRTHARHLLSVDGWEVIEVGLAIDAIEIAGVVKFDAVVMDLSLTGMSGFDAIPVLCDLGCPVVVCSAFGSDAGATLHAGASAVVDKTEIFRLPEVLASLRSIGPSVDA